MNMDTMCARLMSLGITKSEARQMINQIKTWEISSGVQWTVNRLKEYKTMFLKKLAGESYQPNTYISVGENGLPKGPFQVLFRRFGENQISKVLTGLNAYSAYVGAEPTEVQKRKFFYALEDTGKEGMNSVFQIVPRDWCYKGEVLETPPSLPQYCVGSTKAPSIYGSCHESDLIAHFRFATFSEPLRDLILRNRDIFQYVLPYGMFLDESKVHERSTRLGPWGIYYEDNPLVDTVRLKANVHTFGTISGIQEPGMKLRVIANPARVLQCALEPLKRILQRTLEKVAEDCTFHQEKALPHIQEWIRTGRTVYSVDLSDATTRFPWPVTRQLLLDLFPAYHAYISIMDEVSRGPWACDIRTKGEVVSFQRGQPLGLGPSFFAFAMSHHALLRGICHKHNLPKDYFILGDDIVIGNDELARVYKISLGNLGCKISWDKTFESKHLAEFAGYSITSNRIGKGLKWKDISDHSFLRSVDLLGKGAMSYLTIQQRAVAELLGHIPRPYGGLGWGDGSSLQEWNETPYGKEFLDCIVGYLSEKDEALNLVQERSSYSRNRMYWDLVQEHAEAFSKSTKTVLSDGSVLLSSMDSYLSRQGQSLYDNAYKNAIDQYWVEAPKSDPVNPASSLEEFSNIVEASRLSDEKLPLPIRVLGAPIKGYHPVTRRSSDPRPNHLMLVICAYNAKLLVSGKRNKLIESFIHRNLGVKIYNEMTNVLTWKGEIQSMLQASRLFRQDPTIDWRKVNATTKLPFESVNYGPQLTDPNTVARKVYRDKVLPLIGEKPDPKLGVDKAIEWIKRAKEIMKENNSDFDLLVTKPVKVKAIPRKRNSKHL